MKRSIKQYQLFIIIFTLLQCSYSTFAQNQKRFTIKVKQVNHYYKEDKKGKLTKRISNKNNTPVYTFVFDTIGNVIEETHAGFKDINKYDNERIVGTITYLAGKNIMQPYTKTSYFYNEKNQLIKEIILDYLTDTIRLKFEYEYDERGNLIKTIFDTGYYYFRTFDSSSKLISLKQFYQNKLRWEQCFWYTDTSRVCDMKTYYTDGNNYTKSESEFYNNGKLVRTIIRYTSEAGISEMTKFYYDEYGLVNKIEFYESYPLPLNTSYINTAYTEIKVKDHFLLNEKLTNKINLVLLGSY